MIKLRGFFEAKTKCTSRFCRVVLCKVDTSIPCRRENVNTLIRRVSLALLLKVHVKCKIVQYRIPGVWAVIIPFKTSYTAIKVFRI